MGMFSTCGYHMHSVQNQNLMPNVAICCGVVDGSLVANPIII